MFSFGDKHTQRSLSDRQLVKKQSRLSGDANIFTTTIKTKIKKNFPNLMRRQSCKKKKNNLSSVTLLPDFLNLSILPQPSVFTEP